MKSKIHELPKETYMRVSKKLLVLTAIIAASSLIATKGFSQVYVGARFGRVGVAHVGVGFPVYHRPYFHGPAVYGGAYVAPAPVYAAPAPVYDAPAYAPVPPVIDYNEYPGYEYYNYPAWYGHFRDRVYYEHYRPFFMRSHPYYRGGFHGRRW